ncbi:MAG: CDP-glycerol glycerophosphotransferase family protein [Lachnospiraceae bacterium]|nr:CDP-glycerol glycerophosphotransferase family protein [Lachnospiraceae bacterium]
MGTISEKILRKVAQLKLRMMPLSINKNSEVEFYLVDAFEIEHFFPFYKQLRKMGIDAAFVAEPCDINTAGKWFDYDAAVSILKDKGIKYYDRANRNAKVAVTTQFGRNLKKYKKACKRIQLSYGEHVMPMNAFQLDKKVAGEFDYIFVMGEIKKKRLETAGIYGKAVVISYPKHLDFFLQKWKTEDIRRELNIQTDRPILMYYPTWGDYSSIPIFGREIGKLKDKFYIISKPHHCTFRLLSEKNNMDILYEISDRVLDGNYDFAKSTLLGDIAISDATSGASAEVAFLNPQIKLLLLGNESMLEAYKDDILGFAAFVSQKRELVKMVNAVMREDDI